MYVDILLEMAVDQLRLKDLKVMKTIHDVKNPVYSLVATINDASLDILKVRHIANADLEDLLEMCNNLNVEFKSKYKMPYQEEKREVNSVDMLENISRAHIRLALNGSNQFCIETDYLVPK